ncbi:MAG: hypothetical protein MHM6MM_004027 [Cercozoa sp. M6MM]
MRTPQRGIEELLQNLSDSDDDRKSDDEEEEVQLSTELQQHDEAAQEGAFLSLEESLERVEHSDLEPDIKQHMVNRILAGARIARNPEAFASSEKKPKRDRFSDFEKKLRRVARVEDLIEQEQPGFHEENYPGVPRASEMLQLLQRARDGTSTEEDVDTMRAYLAFQEKQEKRDVFAHLARKPESQHNEDATAAADVQNDIELMRQERRHRQRQRRLKQQQQQQKQQQQKLQTPVKSKDTSPHSQEKKPFVLPSARPHSTRKTATTPASVSAVPAASPNIASKTNQDEAELRKEVLRRMLGELGPQRVSPKFVDMRLQQKKQTLADTTETEAATTEAAETEEAVAESESEGVTVEKMLQLRKVADETSEAQTRVRVRINGVSSVKAPISLTLPVSSTLLDVLAAVCQQVPSLLPVSVKKLTLRSPPTPAFTSQQWTQSLQELGLHRGVMLVLRVA